MKRPTIADIARRAGVSKVAVSYALNGQAGVSEATRRRIRAIADELGWSPNTAARALSGASAYAVGLVVCRPARILGVEPFFMQLISGFETALSARSYGLTLQVVASLEAEIEVYHRWWAERRVDGVILVDLRVDDPRVPVLEHLGLPAIVIGNPRGAGRMAGVWSDDAAALVEVVDHLVGLGHTRIARVTGLPELLHTRIRDEAFTAACSSAGVSDFRLVAADYTGESSASVTRALLSSAAPPTALVYDNDVMAVAGLGVAQELGLSVPRDVSLVAWDDSPLCRLVHPALTAISRDIPAYGAHAAQRLLAAIGGEPVSDFQDTTPHLVVRGSTAAPSPHPPPPPRPL
ncbi:LacI family transcriptional regulator [Virgisporangium aliadipatigenens]|uniref:LacI family transcriptional regulator n=1 Tax=Virgisporangium aliadipatigenens TaxID=741659 RepID=A0A8J3YFR2_9ACTN|nr:LacI family transcriptional regulator [Virgisporangium aliadipatigenens]